MCDKTTQDCAFHSTVVLLGVIRHFFAWPIHTRSLTKFLKQSWMGTSCFLFPGKCGIDESNRRRIGQRNRAMTSAGVMLWCTKEVSLFISLLLVQRTVDGFIVPMQTCAFTREWDAEHCLVMGHFKSGTFWAVGHFELWGHFELCDV
jgi:hypothetical protein